MNSEHLMLAFNVVLALHGAALVVVNFTDTPKDNKWVKRVYRVIEAVAGVLKSDKMKQV